ncbi:hypothetical protein BCU75_01940 [Vibrio splendidus]|nr:hypothetical protein BCU75_01940 [Vibrio splendidus]
MAGMMAPTTPTLLIPPENPAQAPITDTPINKTKIRGKDDSSLFFQQIIEENIIVIKTDINTVKAK